MSTAMNRLLWWHWLLIGFGASLILFLILFFAVVKPKNEETARVRSEADSIETAGGTPEKVTAKQREWENSKKETVRINQEWRVQSAAYMPPIEFHKDPLPTYATLSNSRGVYSFGNKSYGVEDLPSVWGRWITYWYDRQWRDGVKQLNLFPIESFSSDPNDVSQLKAIAFPQSKPWDVEVSAKDFNAAMRHLNSFNSMRGHGMPVVDKVALSGQSPDLRLRYTLQLFVIPPTEPPAADPKISGAGGGGGGGGGGGPRGGSSMGMGMPGMSGGGMGMSGGGS